MAFPETRSLIRSEDLKISKKVIDVETSSSEDWSSSYTSESSNSRQSSEGSFAVEWEEHVNLDGSLFYLEYDIQPAQQTLHGYHDGHERSQGLVLLRKDFKRTSTRRSKKTGNRLSNILNGKYKSHKDVSKKKISMNKSGMANRNETAHMDRDAANANKVKFNEMAEGELKEIIVFIDPSMRHKFGRRTSASEALLGVSVCTFPDSTRIMIAGYMPNAEISQDKAIKIGDWLKSINNHEINTENFEIILLSFNQPTYIKLQLKSIAAEVPPQHDMGIGKVFSTSDFVDSLRTFFPPLERENGYDAPVFNLLFLDLKECDGQSTNDSEIIFSFPNTRESNCLFNIRGTFKTLNSLFRECTFNAKPKISTIIIQNIEYYVTYHSTNTELLLIAIPVERITLQCAKSKISTIIRYFEFCKCNLRSAFNFSGKNISSKPDEELKNFSAKDTCSILTFMLSSIAPLQENFEDSLQESQYVPLPKEGQLRIDDALNEMEAMDYRDWNEEPLKSQREFFILGSALYFRKYLLAFHLSRSDLLDIEAFLRINAIQLLIEHHPIRDLIIWKEIFPETTKNCGISIDQSNERSTKSRWFLAIVARNQLLMAVVLESRLNGSHDEPSSSFFDYIDPSRFYIEEIQDTLDHLQNVGVESLASTWINANKRPETLLFKNVQVHESRVNVGTAVNGIHSTGINILNTSAATSSSASTVDALTMNLKNTEVISILKRRNNSSENVNDTTKFGNSILTINGGSPSMNSQSYSETSLQKYNDDDDDSDSDWDGFPGSQRSSSGFDMSEMTSTFIREISDVFSSKVAAGKENILFHYVQIEIGEGIVLAPPSSQVQNIISYSFQKASLLIHSILQNTIRFRNLLSQEASTSNMHRSLVAIREHGILISTDNNNHQPFWVIGRLFSNPCKELYVCHRVDVPQNLVEIAFRLTLHSAG